MPNKKEIKPLAFKPDSLKGISQKNIEIHHGKLYAGYVNKSNEIWEKLTVIAKSGKHEGNQVYSELRGLKAEETFANNGAYLHENYFEILGGDGIPKGEISQKISEKWVSMENFKSYFTACGMSARGWAILCWNMHEKELMLYNGDAHNQGAVWGAIPLISLDIYEHAYFVDNGSDRTAYINNFFNNLNWNKIEELYQKAKKLVI